MVNIFIVKNQIRKIHTSNFKFKKIESFYARKIESIMKNYCKTQYFKN